MVDPDAPPDTAAERLERAPFWTDVKIYVGIEERRSALRPVGIGPALFVLALLAVASVGIAQLLGIGPLQVVGGLMLLRVGVAVAETVSRRH